MTNSRALANRWSVTAGAVVLTALVVRFVATPAQIQTVEPVPYRVELVHNDPYKVSAALNNMSKQGWYFISSVGRNDSKILLIFRKSD